MQTVRHPQFKWTANLSESFGKNCNRLGHSFSARQQSRLARAIGFLREDIDTDHVDLQLIALGFGTGVADVMSYKEFHVFTSNQTGNIVLFAVRVSGVATNAFSSVCASLFGFLVAGFISGQLSHQIGDHRRWWLMFNTLVQSILIFVVVALTSADAIRPGGDRAYVLILLLAISYGCQMAMARHLSCPEIPTAVLTSPFIDLLTDAKLFKQDNVPRNRRVAYLLVFIGGIVIGSFAYTKVSSEFTLAIAGVVKALVMASFLLNPKARTRSPSSA